MNLLCMRHMDGVQVNMAKSKLRRPHSYAEGREKIGNKV